MGLFDDLEDDVIVSKNIKIEARAEKSKLKKELKTLYRNQNCIDLIESVGGLPLNDEIINFVSNGASDTGSFLEAMIKEFGIIDEIYLSTWTISQKNVNRLVELFDNGTIKKLVFVINNGLLATNSTKSIWGSIRENFSKRNIKFVAVNAHAKVFCVKAKDRFVTVSGSGNWSENPRIENYFLIGGQQSYNFNKSWMEDMFNE